MNPTSLTFSPVLSRLLAVAMLIMSASGQVPNTLMRSILGAPGGVAGDQFGTSVRMSGSLMVVGVPFDDTGATDSGKAYVYDLSSATASVPIFTLTNPSPAVNDQFGAAVGISGMRVVVGAYGDNTNGSNAGSAYVYDLGSATPTDPIATLYEPSPSNSFGFAVGISGSLVVVGANFNNTGATSAGAAYVFDVSSATPTIPPTLAFTLFNPVPVAGDRFGRAVAISGTRVVVGAYLKDIGAADTGSAYVYDLAGGTPTVPTATLNNPSPGVGDWFGRGVAISGTRILVAAPLDSTGASRAGSAYVYDVDVANPTPTVPVETLNNPNPVAGDNFGTGIAIAGTSVVVGAYMKDIGATDAGAAYVFDLGSATPTIPVATLNNPTPEAGDNFGVSVAVGADTVAVAAPLDDTIAADAGAVYIFGPDSLPPLGGIMTLLPSSPVDASAALTVSFSNWTDASPPLAYTVLLDDVIISPAGATSSRNITGPAIPGTHVLKGRIADSLGNVAEVTQNFTVLTAQESWRRLYFGTPVNSGDGADTADPDGDGCTNVFEYVAGLVPTDPNSRFMIRAEEVPGQATQKAIIFSPIIAGRTYVVKSKADLTDLEWVALTNFSPSDDGAERTVIDLAASTGQKFYHVEITMP